MEIIEILELSEKDFKITVIEMFKLTIISTSETTERIISLSKKIEKLSK